ncbi:MAG: cation:proton antiporter [Thermoplasmata archaeon]|nr:MAG: cation:proton antiporter [Thermoplasmata archaeon]
MTNSEAEYVTLLVASVIAFLMPYVANRFKFPVIVGEIVLGIAVGFIAVGIERVFHVTFLTFSPESAVFFLSEIGLIFLLFLAGLEIDFNMISERGARPMMMGIIAFVATFTIALAIVAVSPIETPIFMALIISTTSLGVVLPVLREMGIGRTQYGQDVILGAIIADFGTMIMIPLVVAAQKGTSLILPLIVLPFVALVFVALYYLGGYLLWKWPESMSQFFANEDPNETGVRASFLLIMIFVVLAALLETEVILGAFLAGAAISFLFRESGTLESKLFGFGFGFLIPLFFVRVGVEFAHSVTEEGGLAALWIVPVLVGVTLVAKVIPQLYLVPTYGLRRAVSQGVLLSGGLSLAIVAAEIGRAEGILDQAISAAVIFFAIVMAILSPIIFRNIVTEKDAEVDEEQVFELVTVDGKPLEGGIDPDSELNPDNWVEVSD